MAHALVTATRMAASGECTTVHVRLNKRAKTATLDGCVYKQLFVHAKYEVAAYVVHDVEKVGHVSQCAPLLQVPVPVALTAKLLIAPLVWVHAHPPKECDALFIKAVWERALQEHTYPPLRLSSDTTYTRSAPPMLRLHLSPHGAVIASITTHSAARPEGKEVKKAAVSKAKKKCAPKKKRRDEEDDVEEDEEETCKADESEEEIEEEDEESEEKDEEIEEEEEEESVDEQDEEEGEADDEDEGGDEIEEVDENEEFGEDEEESDVDDTVKSEEEEVQAEKGRTKKRTKS